DFNGDHKFDIATANAGYGGTYDISVLLGNGDGTMQAAKSIILPGEFPPGYTGGTPLPQQPWSVAVGDFNRDGKLDLAAGGRTSWYAGVPPYTYSYSNAYANVLLGNGAGNFTSAEAKLLGGSNPSAMAVADFNADAKPDLV